MGDTRTAAQRALEHLDTQMRLATAAGRTRLPTLADLSRAAGVAKGTMQRAVRRRVADGLLSARHRAGVTLARPGAQPSEQPSAPLPVSGTPWLGRKPEWLARAIRRDITNGVHSPGEQLPRAKQLCSDYGVAFRTLKAALARLVDRREVVPWGRGYRVPAIAASPHGGTVLVVARGTGSFVQLVTERTAECMAVLERECSGRGLTLRVAPAYFQGPELGYGDHLERLTGKGAALRDVLGIVFFSATFDPAVCRRVVADLALCGVPLAVIDEDAAADLGELPAGHRAKVIALAYGATCGETVGRMLAQLGHRRVAYVTAWEDAAWSQGRHAGMLRALRTQDNEQPVRLIPIRAGMADDRGSGSQPLTGGAGRMLRAMHRHRPLQRGLLWPEQQIERLMESYAPWQDTRSRLSELLADSSITAWVADNDMTALACLSFLESRRVKVPERISVAGFDDGNCALVNNLTSYNFNCRSAMLAALHHLLSPPAGRTGHGVPGRVEIEGFVAQRLSTGPALDTASDMGGTRR